MASRRAILRAAKASAPSGRPTAPPQGAQPYFGSMSPAIMQNQVDHGYASAYGSFLPRPPQTFTQGAFGPFSPILSVPVDTPTESGRAEPRREQFEVGWNLPVGEPGTEGIKMATFPTLRTLADLYSVARACIQTRKSEIRGLEWDIMPTADAAKANKGNEKWFTDFGQRRAIAMKFFRRPDPDYFSWNSFLDAFLEEIFVFDALSLYLRPKRGKGMRKGVFGSDLDSIELLSGPTIRPLYGIHGEFPRPPAPAYQQYLYGVPRSDFMRMVTDADVEDSGISGSLWNQFRGDQLLYLPMTPRRWTPYGFPPIERALIPVMSGLQKQGYALDFFREGTVPAVYVSPGDASMTPNQIRELQDALNAFAGDPAFHHKIIVLPPGSKTMPQRDAQLADQFDEVIMNQVCMAFDVMPMELGISPKVSTTMSPGASNQMAKMTSNTAQRKSTKPLLIYISEIMNSILQTVCGQDDMEFVFEGLQEEQDQEQLTNLLVQQVNVGMRSIDEARDELNLQPWGLPETSGPVFFSPAVGPIPLGSEIQQSLQQAQAMPPQIMGAGAQAPMDNEVAAPGGAKPGSGDKPAGQPAGIAGQQNGQKKPAPREVGDTPQHAAAEAQDTQSGRQSNAGGMASGATHGTANNSAQGDAKNSQTGSKNQPKDTDEKSNTTSSKFVVTVGLAKAINSELEALSRHVRKGRLISSWVPKNIPPRTLAAVSEYVSKGCEIGDARSIAKTPTLAPPPPVALTPPPATQTPIPPQAQTVPPIPPVQGTNWAGWLRDVALAELYRHHIRKGFQGSFFDLKNLAGDVIKGSVTVTASVLKGLMHTVLKANLLPVLTNLWQEAWYLGNTAAHAAVENMPVDWGHWVMGKPATAPLGDTADTFERTILGNGLEVIDGIANTKLDQVLVALREADSPEALADHLDTLLDIDNRSTVIAQTETTRLSSLGAMNRYGIAGVTKIEWNTEPGACTVCQANEDQGSIPVGDTFVSGAPCPPQHPNCRCSLNPMAFAGDLGKARRGVAINGQEAWYDPYAAGGGGQSPVRHWGDGTQAPDGVPVTGGVPGSTAGGEPPRWDTPVANGYQGGLHDFSEGVNPAQGNESGDDANQPYNTDRWPSGQTQTYPPSGTPIGGSAQGPGDPTRSAWGITVKDTGLVAAGIAVLARDSGRILMLQRANNPTTCPCGMPVAFDESNGWQHADGSISHDVPFGDQSVSDLVGNEAPDPAAGFWEFPGGCLEPGENPLQAAKREWSEETGLALPPGTLTGRWDASNGKYRGFVWTVPSESDIPLHDGRDEVSNPDDPDGDHIESLAWWDPSHLADNPAVRPELSGALDDVLNALGAVAKAATSQVDGPVASAADVHALMERNFPDSALEWVSDATWRGPMPVPLSEIDFTGDDSWAASHQSSRVDHFTDKIRAGEAVHPAILVDTPGRHDLMIVDGHHRALAARKLGEPVLAYVGTVDAPTGPWDETHSYQVHQGESNHND